MNKYTEKQSDKYWKQTGAKVEVGSVRREIGEGDCYINF